MRVQVWAVVMAATVALGLMAAPAMAQGCVAQVTVPWSGAKGYKIIASAKGGPCASAAISLSIVDPNGKATNVYSAKADENAEFVEVTNLKSMQAALNEWVARPAQDRRTTAELSAWPKGADQPEAGEFPFYPDEQVNQAFYEAVRVAGRPMLCFTQGMESALCVFVNSQGGVDALGAQSFPG